MNRIDHILWQLIPLLIVCGTIDGAEDDIVGPVQVVAVQRVIGLAQPAFVERVPPADQLVFGCTEKDFQWRIEQQIGNRIVEIGITHGLTEEQLMKLNLAATVELRHFFHEVDEFRRRSEAIEIIRDGRNANDLIESKQNLFGPNSMFAKVSAKIITAEHLATHRQMVETQTSDRMRVRHRVNIDAVIREFERRLDLRIYQKVYLIRLMLNEIEPPKNFGNFDDMVLKYRLARFFEGKLRPLFDDDQWPLVCTILGEFREFRTVLLRRGLIESNSSEIGAAADQRSKKLLIGATDPSSPADASSPANRAED